MNPAITVRNLNVRYGQSTALRDVSFSVFSGQRLFIAGANGAGHPGRDRVNTEQLETHVRSGSRARRTTTKSQSCRGAVNQHAQEP